MNVCNNSKLRQSPTERISWLKKKKLTPYCCNINTDDDLGMMVLIVLYPLHILDTKANSYLKCG